MVSSTTTFNNLIIFLSTFSSKRGLNPVCQSSFYPLPPYFVMHLKSGICAGCDGADINLAASPHECSGGIAQMAAHSLFQAFASQGQVVE